MTDQLRSRAERSLKMRGSKTSQWFLWHSQKMDDKKTAGASTSVFLNPNPGVVQKILTEKDRE
jgi:hypothetical protein